MSNKIFKILSISSIHYNYCGCLKKCIKNKNKEEDNKSINNKDMDISEKKIKTKYLKLKKFKFTNGDKILRNICKKIKGKKNKIKLDKDENINRIKVSNYEKLEKYFSNEEELNKLEENEKNFIKQFLKIKDKEEEEIETVIPYIKKDSELGFIDENTIISETNKGYKSDVPDNQKELVKIVKEVIGLLKSKNKETNGKNNVKIILDEKSKNPLYVFGYRVFKGNVVDDIYNLLFNFKDGDGCYQVIANKTDDKKTSKNENVTIKTINNSTDNKIANLSFIKHTKKAAVIDIFHKISNDFYKYVNDEDNEFTVYVDSNAIYEKSKIGGHLNIYVDIVYKCVYDETNKCTYFITLNSAHYEFLNKLEEWFNKGSEIFKKIFSKKTKEENEKEAIGIYVEEIKEQNDENVKKIFKYIDEKMENYTFKD